MTIETHWKPTCQQSDDIRLAWMKAHELKRGSDGLWCLDRFKTGNCKCRNRKSVGGCYEYGEGFQRALPCGLDHVHSFSHDNYPACFVGFNYSDPQHDDQGFLNECRKLGLFTVVSHWSINNWYGYGTTMIEVWRPDVLRAIIEKRHGKCAVEFFDQALQQQLITGKVG